MTNPDPLCPRNNQAGRPAGEKANLHLQNQMESGTPLSLLFTVISHPFEAGRGGNRSAVLTARQICCPQQTSFLQTCFRIIRSLTHPSLLWFPPQEEKVALTAASHALSGKCPCSRGRAASQCGSTWTDLCGCRNRGQVSS